MNIKQYILIIDIFLLLKPWILIGLCEVSENLYKVICGDSGGACSFLSHSEHLL